MKPSLQLKLSQHLALTPQLQQSIKLLQLSTLELEQELEKYLQENPLLEREDDSYTPARIEPSMTSTGEPEQKPAEAEPEAPPSNNEESWLGEGDGSDAGYANTSGSFDDDEDGFQDIQAATVSLREHLSSQLGLLSLASRDRTLVQCLIDALDDDGYLTQSLEDLAESLPAELEIDPDELQIALRHLQQFDPTGVGARSAQECLALQLRALAGNETRDLAFNHVAGLEAFKQGIKLFGAFALNNGAVRNHNISAAVFNADNQKRHAAAHNLGGVFRRGNAKLAARAEGLFAKHVNRIAALAHCGYAAVNRHCRIAGFFKRGNAAAAHGAGKANLLRGNTSNPRFEAVAGLNAFIALGIKNVFAVNDAVNLYAHVHKNAVASNGDYSSGHFLAGLQAV